MWGDFLKHSNRIGISFVFPDSYHSHLGNIFTNINYLEYTWYVSDSEILYHNKKTGRSDTSIFMDGVYTGDSFRNIVSNSVYYVVYARIFAVPKGKSITVDTIVDFDSYLRSCCEMALLCADCCVDFYSKNNNILDLVEVSCINNSYEQLSDIIFGNDSRMSFYI